MSITRFYSGTSGLVLPVPNKTYYPLEFKGQTRLTYYASLFDSIEINSSFYKIPRPQTIAKWANEVPANFRFTFKLWRGITHEKGLLFKPGDIFKFMEAIQPAEAHKGCLLIQFPPSARVHLMPQLQDLIHCLQTSDSERSWKLAVEFRHSSWYNDNIRELAHQYQLAIVMQDIPASTTPFDFVDGDVVYLRFHGPGGRYRGSYPEDLLQEYSNYILDWQEQGKTVYAYFNNTVGDAVYNLVTLNAFVRQAENQAYR